ncbi:MAG: carboxy-S-adenosyl-L-methionine synthase CmoA [Campylobacteraceae bacterium 4484_166]|nr:MAG: carboxy-S-adenosyl-L-methionine synthase CmoA [Campylobacteraceae bacterium 4484_166]
MKDRVFTKAYDKQFEFDDTVASVFDDMLKRSVPYYTSTTNMMTNIASCYIQKGDMVFDLGCSTGETMIKLHKTIKKDAILVGVDSSKDMIKIATNKAKAYDMDIKFITEDIFDTNFDGAKVIFANYILQFIRPLKREQLIQKIYNKLKVGGVLIFSEKIIYTDKKLDKISIDEYIKYKKSKGYSDFEISTKREMLENVLVPYSEQENKDMIAKAGFDECQTIFKWLNFATFIAIKR